MLGAARAGRNAFLVAPTGAGKTLAGFLPSLVELIEANPPQDGEGDRPAKPDGGGGSLPAPKLADPASSGEPPPPPSAVPSTGLTMPRMVKGRPGDDPTRCSVPGGRSEGLHTLYVSPLKALAVDVQRNLLTPIAEMGLPIRVETRTGDTPSDRKARQRVRPPHILLTTPESLSLLLSYDDSDRLFAGLKSIVIDEVHAFAPSKRGDLLALCMARLQRYAPDMRRVALSATVADPEAYQAWLAPHADIDSVDVVIGDPGADAEMAIMLPDDERIPWSGHSGRWAAAQVMEQIRSHKTTLVFCNTRSLAELIFQDLWAVNDEALPIGVHHGSLSREARRKVEQGMADGRIRALVCTASLDLGVDWGDVDLVIQMGAPKGSSRLVQRIGRANHRLDQASQGIVVPGNRFEYLEARAALDAIDADELDPDHFRPGALDVLAQHVMACACAAPFHEAEMLEEVRSAAPF
ncbi:MAG: ATP-dependent, 3'-5' DNA helicase with strand annealing activity, partial [uncultured Sphingomonadaceae bacterium]